MKVFVEKVEGEFRTVNDYTAWRGFVDRGCETEFFRAADIETLPLCSATPVVSGIPTVHRALRTLGCAVPELEAIPDELQGYAGREIGQGTLGEVRCMIAEERGPLFIKPVAGQTKRFNGHVVAAFKDLIQTAPLDDAQAVWWSQVVQLRAEFRGFVHRGELVGFRHYFGDFRAPVDFSLVDAALSDWKTRPIGCSMDWGVTDSGRTVLIEVNDGYSLGCYGLAPHLYAPLLADRWHQMTQS